MMISLNKMSVFGAAGVMFLLLQFPVSAASGYVSSIIQLTNGTGENMYVWEVSGNGHKIIYRKSTNVFVTAADNTGTVQEIPLAGGNYFGIDFDGRKVLFYGRPPGTGYEDTYIFDTETGSYTLVTPCADFPYGHECLGGYPSALSGDGRYVFLTSTARWGDPNPYYPRRLWRLPVSGGAPVLWVGEPLGDVFKVVSNRDGAVAAFLASTGITVRREGSTPINFETACNNNEIALSPDGQWVVCGLADTLKVFRTDGTDQRTISLPGEDTGAPFQYIIKQDNKSVIYYSAEGGRMWSVNLDGTGLTALTPPKVWLWSGIASSDGRTLAFVSHADLVGNGNKHYQVFVGWLEAPNLTAGCKPCATAAGEPIDTATGEFYTEPKVDIDLGGPLPLFFSRTYASRLSSEGAVQSSLGSNWMHNFDIRLTKTSLPARAAKVIYERGNIINFEQPAQQDAWLVKSTAEDTEETVYQLREGSNREYWFMDPNRSLVYRFYDAPSDLFGKLREIQDRNGNTLTFTYDASGNLTQVTDGLGRTLTFTYNASGNLTQISDGTRTLTYAYTNGVLTSFTDAMGNKTTYIYQDPVGSLGPLLTSVQYPLGNRHHTQTYDAQGRVIK